MSPGFLHLFMLHMLLTSGKDKVYGLSKTPEALITKTQGGSPGQVYCS
jgi:hypothetical protein